MFDLCPRRVSGFSTGCLLAPRGWTSDVAAHYIVHSSTVAAAAAAAAAFTDSDCHDGATLPLFSSSNTARFECMTEDQEGSTLYVTELFVPRQSASSNPSPAVAPRSWDAERLRSLLLFQRCCAVSGTPTNACGAAQNSADNTQVWVTEIKGMYGDEGHHDGETESKQLTPSTSLYAALHPFYSIVVEVVWILGPSGAAPACEEATQRIVADLEQRYRTPALELDTFRCLSLRSSATDAPFATLDIASTPVSATSVQPPQREPCAPAILADTHASNVSPLFASSLYSSTGRTFIQLLQAPESQRQGDAPPQLVATDARWSVNCEGTSAAPAYPGSAEKPASCEDAAPPVTRAPAAAMRHLLQDRLSLHWEGLSVALRVASGAMDAEVVLAVATLELSAVSSAPTSLYSFPSVEAAWAAHVASTLHAEQATPSGQGTEAGRGRGLRPRWVMEKLSTTPFPSLGEMRAAVEEAEATHLGVEDPFITAAERVMRGIAAYSASSAIAPRCSTYLLQLVAANAEPSLDTATGPGSAKRGGGGEEVAEAYLVQLYAPRVQSRHAVVVCMPVPVWALGGECAASTATMDEVDDAKGTVSPQSYRISVAHGAAALSACYRLAPYTPLLWLPRDVGRVAVGGVCCRSGRLVLHVPSASAAYTNVRLAPVASRAFASLGSIAVCVRRGVSGVDSSSLLLPTGAAFQQVGAVWTLVGDGRSAATYLEDALMEHMYDTGSKNLNNIAQPSQHTRQPGVLVVRRRQRQKMRAVSTSTRGAAAALISSHEVCSAWIDIGATHRLLLRVRDVGVGEVIVTEASLIGAHTEETSTASTSTSVAAQVSRAEEEALEEWVDGIAASAVPKSFR